MKLGIIDVREWQTIVDFNTGRKANLIRQNEMLAKISHLLKMHPFPGDTDPRNSTWVTDTALHLNQIYHPDFMFLSYSQPFFTSVFQQLSDIEWQAIVTSVKNEVERFVAESGFLPIIIGGGATIPLQGEIDLSSLEGLVSCGGMGPTYAGLYNPSQQDLKAIHDDKRVKKILTRKQIIEEWGGTDDFTSRLPDYLLIANKGYYFRGMGNISRILYRLNGPDEVIPVNAPFKAENIADIAPGLQKLFPGQRAALIVIEGLGCENFPFTYEQCDNTFSWYAYGTGDAQYLALTSGQHVPCHPFPPGYKYYRDDGEEKPYPFSGPYRYLPENVIGADPGIKSAAVGSRSILTHIASGADITVECFARALYNYGTMAVFDNNIE